MEIDTVQFEGELDCDFIFHKLSDNWAVKPDPMGINKVFNYMPSSKHENKWNDLYAQKFLFNVAIKPFDWFFAEFGFEIRGDYADRYWVPVNEEHRLKNNDKRFDWNNAKIGVVKDWGSLTYYRSYAHQSWKYEGDMFEMFPAEDLPDNLLRYSGHHAPEYFQLKTSEVFGDLDVIYGIEALENYKNGIYVKYKNIFGSNINFFYSDHIIPFGVDDERMKNFQLNTDFDILENNLQIGVLYRPFRLKQTYQYVDDVGVGNGLDGSRYNVKIGTTNEVDALGGSAKLNASWVPGIDTLVLDYEYRGLVAGNRQKMKASVERQIAKTFNACFGYCYQKPLLKAMPTIYSGTNGDGKGPLSMSGRSCESPFWVWWRNPVTGFDNRETSEISLVFTYDPTPETWFYRFEPNNPAEYNLNPKEDAPFSFAAKFSYAKYYGTLDRQVHWDYKGDITWEPIGMNGTAATDKYVGSTYLLAQFVKNNTKILYDVEIGEDVATLAYAYSNRESFLSPIVGYFKTSLTINAKPYLFKTAYLKNYWGPEYWHRQFGLGYDDLYLVHISRDLGGMFNIGVEYVCARKTDSKILDTIKDIDTKTNEMGSFDEIRIFFKVFFGSIFKFGEEKKNSKEKDTTVPDVSVKLSDVVVFPDKKQILTIEPYAWDNSGIANWNVYIKDSSGVVVKTYLGQAEPKEQLEWDGGNENNGKISPVGMYSVTIEAYDNYGNYAVSEPKDIRVMITPKTEDAKIKETERGLEIALNSEVLFDIAKSTLKVSALKTLKMIVQLLQVYIDNSILIEGYTDSQGKEFYNQKLSERRADSVKRCLVSNGVSQQRIKTVGYGQLKPIATNNTAAGRKQNRRVEIIILKQKDNSTTNENVNTDKKEQ
jgi:outer membrane protein OmpA-like peptidoglycan-associated protein